MRFNQSTLRPVLYLVTSYPDGFEGDIAALLLDSNAETTVQRSGPGFWSVLVSLLPLLIFVGLVAMLAGGRAAEELVFGDPTTGASNDLEKAPEIARQMVTRFGMTGALGFMRLSDGEQGLLGQSLGSQQSYSDGTASAIDEEVRRLLDNSQREADTILSAHRNALDAMAAELLANATLVADDIARLFSDVPKWRREDGGNGVLHREPGSVNRVIAA